MTTIMTDLNEGTITKNETSQYLVDAQRLHRYHGECHAVNGVSLQLEKGEVLGLLGPNGAGKSTLMQMLSGNLAPVEGRVLIKGIDLLENPRLAKSHIGYLPEQPPVYRDMKVAEYLAFCSRIHDISDSNRQGDIEYAMARCGLEEVGKRLIGNLSKGYQQRVGIAQAILHKPEVVILDEPTVGLDPVQIAAIRQLIRDLAQDHGVILSTHILPEIQAICDRVQIMNRGRTVHADSLRNLSDSVSKRAILRLQPHSAEQVEQDKICIKKITDLPSVCSAHILSAGEFDVQSHSGLLVNHLCQLAVQEEWIVHSIRCEERTLESIFLDLVHKEPEK